MSARDYLSQQIAENQVFLRQYESALSADPNDFGAKLMVGNIQRHLQNLQKQQAETHTK
jgi:hypothetical protein